MPLFRHLSEFTIHDTWPRGDEAPTPAGTDGGEPPAVGEEHDEEEDGTALCQHHLRCANASVHSASQSLLSTNGIVGTVCAHSVPLRYDSSGGFT